MASIAGSMRIAVLGAGKIGSSMVRSFISCGHEVIATGRSQATLERASRLGALATRDNAFAVQRAELVVISVKPRQLPALVSEIRGLLKSPTVSVVAGVSTRVLEGSLRVSPAYRAMPNINAEIGRSTTALAGRREHEWSRTVEEVMSCLGSLFWIEEEWMDAWTALVGSMPAFLALIVDYIALGGVYVGIPRELAVRAVLDVMRSTAEHLLQRPIHPQQLRDEVTTPAGVTVEGLRILEARGVPAALIEAIEASTHKSRKIGLTLMEELKGVLG
ncbi:MAG: pyrroline-5-carboxylate reductase [Acidilobaceae archaeon]|nr:pyrroline-5-carboxylate reductase [Acidilobaceae archaeon]